jgi:WD40 repeat protein
MTSRVDAYGDPLPPFAEARFGTARWRHHGVAISDLAFSADGATVYSAGESVYAFDAATGRVRWSARGLPASHCDLLRRTEGDLLVTAGRGGALQAFDAATGERRLSVTVAVNGPQTVAAAHDGRSIFAGGNDACGLLLEADGSLRAALDVPAGVYLCGARFSPDDAAVLTTGVGIPPTLWSAVDGRVIRDFGEAQRGARSALFTPDGARVVVGCPSGDVAVFDAASGAELARWRAHDAGVSAVALGADGERLLTRGDDRTLALWGLSDGARRAVHPATSSVHRISPDGSTVALDVGSRVALVELATGAERFPAVGHSRSVNVVLLSRDGDTLVAFARGEPVRAWSTAEGASLFELPVTPEVDAARPLPGGDRYALTPPDEGTRVLDLAARSLTRIDGTASDATTTWWGRSAVATSSYGRLTLTNAGGVARTLKTIVDHLAFTPDDGHAVFMDGPKLTAWDLAAQAAAVVVTVRGGWDFVLSPRGDEVAVRSRNGVHRVGVPGGAAVATWKSAEQVTALAYSPDGRLLAAGTIADTAILDCATGREVARVDGIPAGHEAVCFGRDGAALYVGDCDSTVVRWDVAAAVAGAAKPAKKKPAKKAT